MESIKMKSWDKETRILSKPFSVGSEKSMDTINKLFLLFIGLHDKKGKEVYEGDILFDGVALRYIVLWEEKFAKFSLRVINKDLWTFAQMSEAFIIIGNKFENPDLLKY